MMAGGGVTGEDYARGSTYVHRLPAAPGVFKKPFDDLLQKMLLPDTWMYRSNVSTVVP